MFHVRNIRVTILCKWAPYVCYDIVLVLGKQILFKKSRHFALILTTTFLRITVFNVVYCYS